MRDINQYGLEYRKLPFEKEMVRYRKRMLQEKAFCYPHARILEIGCGLEPLFLLDIDFDHLTLIEPSPAFIKNAARLLHQANLQGKVALINGFLEDHVDLLQSKGFDLIILSSLLHEIENPDRFLKAVNAIADSDSIVHINVPNAHSFHRLLALKAGLINSLTERSETQIRLQQHHTFDLQTLSRLCNENGFMIIDQGTYFIKPFTHAQMEALLRKGVIEPAVMDGFFDMIAYMPDLGAEIYMNVKKR